MELRLPLEMSPGERLLVELYLEPGFFPERCTEKLPLRVDFIHRVEFGEVYLLAIPLSLSKRVATGTENFLLSHVQATPTGSNTEMRISGISDFLSLAVPAFSQRSAFHAQVRTATMRQAPRAYLQGSPRSRGMARSARGSCCPARCRIATGTTEDASPWALPTSGQSGWTDVSDV